MSTHSDIIARFTGPAEFARASGMTLGAAKQARRRGSIPPEYWSAVEASGKATLRELAEAAASKRAIPQDHAA